MQLKTISKDFEKKLAEFSAGVISSAEFEKLINIFNDEIKQVYFTTSSEANLIRIIEGMFDKVFLIRECIKYAHYVEILVTVAANSNYLTDILVVNPEFFYWIVNPSTLATTLNEDVLNEEITSTLSAYNSFQPKVLALKAFKRKEILRIGLKDIYLKVSIQEVTNGLSILARSLTTQLYSICYNSVLNKYDIQINKIPYCLVALGKLGGNELNYSSDIDLILIYNRDRKLNNKKLLSELLIETTQLFIRSSADINGGLLYRIDFRLRPDGKNSQLCRSLQEYLNYYESRGEDWERQMLIKLSFLTGNRTLYNKFKTYLIPFIYPSSFTSSPEKQILKMKASIENRLKDEENIKLIHGGIRDIEFSIQALQLLNGGKIVKLQNGNTLQAIEILKDSQLLIEDEAKVLTDGYIFYRRIEHYLQLMNDIQTHVIPEAGEMLEKISFFLAYNSSQEFKGEVARTRRKVRKIYELILSNNDKKSNDRFSLYKINFEDRNRAVDDWQFLRDGKGVTGTRTFDTKSIESFLPTENKIYTYLKNSINPGRTLSNLVRIIKYAEFPSIWYRELSDEAFFIHLMNICEFSQYSIDLFAEDKKLRDFLLSRKVFSKITLNELANTDIKTVLFYFSVQTTVGMLDPVSASGLLSKVIILKVKKIVGEQANNLKWSQEYFVAALGSLGSSELTFFSDLDLIFIVRNSDKYPDLKKHFQNILASLRNNLKPFTVDCRLRPEGKSSQLVWDFEEYKSYFRKRARVWEYQALTKMSFLVGNRWIYGSFTKTAKLFLSQMDTTRIKQELNEMREKISSGKISDSLDLFNIKLNRGGLTDIQFIVQYTILCNADHFIQPLGKSIFDQLKLLTSRKINSSDKNILSNAYNFYKSAELFNQLIFNTTTSKIILEKKKMRLLAKQMNLKSAEHFKAHLKNYSKSVRSIFSKILK